MTYPPPERCLTGVGGCDCPGSVECSTDCACPCHGCDCSCHDDFYGEERAVVDAHAERSCADLQRWLDGDVVVRLQSLRNVTYRHDVSTGLTRREWLELDDAACDETVTEAVLGHVEATVLDDPRDAY